MPISRVFLDWKRPALPVTAAYLRERYGEGTKLDLRNVLVVLPTAEAGRRALELLVDDAEARRWRLVPPEILTLRALPERLYTPKRPFADPLAQQFAWIQALKTLRGRERSRLMRRLPDATLTGWLAFAAMLSQLHRELVANNLDFADVAEQIQTLGEPHEIARWDLLKDVEVAYLRILDDLGLWDRQTARLVAIQEREFAADKDIVLAGLVDLNASHRAMLSQVAERVTALVVAPSSRAEWFDEFGGLIAARWQNAAIEAIYEKTEVVDGPDDQALAVCCALSAWNERFSADQITVGVPDRRIAPAIEERLGECGLSVHSSLGRPLLHTAPARVLSAAADLVESAWFRDFANLARHPAVELWLAHQDVPADWLLELDEYCSTHFPARLDDGGSLKKRRWRTSPRFPALARAVQAVEKLLKPLEGRKQAVTAWVRPIREVLLDLFGIRPLDRNDPQDRRALKACELIQERLAVIEDLPPALAPPVTGAEALRLVLREARGAVGIRRAGRKRGRAFGLARFALG